jgi:hypothetical protein
MLSVLFFGSVLHACISSADVELRVDRDGDGHEVAEDCDDNNSAVHPGAPEVCNGLDDDCDGEADADPVDGTVAYEDLDGDDNGNPDLRRRYCGEPPAGWSANGDDCDDNNASVSPARPEICNGIDDDCDGLVDAEDDSVQDAQNWFEDADGDGVGSMEYLTFGCGPPPEGASTRSDDCDDDDTAVNPEVEDLCGDAVDSDCDPSNDC